MLKLFALTLVVFLPQMIDSCGCGIALPPPCAPQPICAPPPPPCPFPPPCPPTFCPPPPLCPPPPPPPPPQFCPPPSPPPPCGGGCGGGGYAPAPIIPYSAPPPAFNDCCCQCGSPCRYRTMRARTHGARIFSALDAEFDEDPTCNNEKLRNIIEENITKDPTISKRAIQKAAEERLGSKVNVICAKSDFSYVAYTETYCQASSGEVTCYAFKPQ